MQFLLKSSELDIKNILILDHLAEIYLKLNKIHEAFNIYHKILNLDPDNFDVLKKMEQLSNE